MSDTATFRYAPEEMRESALCLEELVNTWSGDQFPARTLLRAAAMLTYAASLQRREDETCEWKEDEDGNWNTSCDEMFTFIDGKPRENYYKFCAHCGRHLVESVYVEPTDDEVQP